MQTINKVQTGDTVKGTSTSTSTSTTYTYSNPSYSAEKGWECPRCGRINAPWVRQCDCSRNDKWDITWAKEDYTKPWWSDYKVTCNGTSAQAQIDSETFKIHPDATVYAATGSPAVGGSDYWDPLSNSYTNTTTYATNTIHDGKLKYKEK